MAANNQPAHIQVGENIGRAESQSLSDGGTQQTGVQFDDIGVILDVTPSINPDGFVRMLIEPSITDLTNRTTQISEDLEVQILTKRERDHDGHRARRPDHRHRRTHLRHSTSCARTRCRSSVTFRCSGCSFVRSSRRSTKTELLIVLTPHVITSPAEEARVREITEGEIERLTVSEEEKERLRRSRVIPEGSQRKPETKPGPINGQQDDTETKEGDVLIDPGP